MRFIPGSLFLSHTCSAETSSERRGWLLLPWQPDEGDKSLTELRRKSNLQISTLVWLLHTSMRNLGLSGMKSLKMRADVRLGIEQRTTNILQL